uniref:General transcription factor IIH subunit 3 n=1 Tax=Trichuris muris TaxID=70415 RepID=A0A5S6QJS1_TRIMR
MSRAEGDLLQFVLVDMNPVWLGRMMEREPEQPASIVQCLIEATVAYCKACCALSTRKELYVFALSSNKHTIIQSSLRKGDPISAESNLSMMSCQIRDGLRRALLEFANEATVSKETKLVPALARSVCRINKAIKGTDAAPSSTSSRILLLKVSDDTTNDYSRLMSVFSTAQKLGTLMDCCAIGVDSALMHQASDITGGIYLKVGDLKTLVAVLMTVFLPTVGLRLQLVLPKIESVDYRPVCCCHQKLVLNPWVCSVCLSVFCTFTPICTTCKTVYKLPLLSIMGKRKKKE